MNRALMFLGLAVLILGLGMVHYSLVNAQPGRAPFTHDPNPEGTHEAHTPVPPTPLPSASISRTSGSVGDEIRVSGSNFGANEVIRITFDNELVATTTATSFGSLSTTFDVPSFSGGRYTIRLESIIPQTFNFTISSSFSITPSSGPPGSSINVRGSGYSPGADIDISMDSNILITASADSQGRLSTTVNIPSQTSGGSKSIEARGPSQSDQGTFNVTATLALAQPQASPGDVVNISGAGFRSSESGISVTFDGQTVVSGIFADTQGVWSSTFEVPQAPAGTHTIKARGSSTSEADVTQAKITLGAGIRVEPPTGPPGTVVRLTGSGSRSRERITITVGNNLATEAVNATTQGVWSADLTIPTAPGGQLNIVASGSSGQGANTTFNVTPVINVDQPTGFPGSRITLRGEGFQANQSGIPVTFGDNIVGAASADPQGSWSTNINIPHSAAGTYSISVPGASGSLKILFSVTAGVSLSTGRGAPGETITVIGSGFTADEKDISIRLGERILTTGIVANADGTWDTRVKIPEMAAGTYLVSATGSLTSSANIREDVLVIGSLLTLNTTSGSPGSTINVTGVGFGSNEPDIDITFDGDLVVRGVSADVVGGFSRSFVIPPSTSGTHLINVNRSGEAGAGDGGTEIGFQVVPGIRLEYEKGSPNSPLQVFGSGFGANEPNISLVFDNKPVVSGITSDAVGSFQSSFLVPNSGAGDHTIQAQSPFSGASGAPTRAFLVSPSLSLSETMGNVGMMVMITGQGFSPESTVTLTYDDVTKATITADDLGSFRLEFNIPESRQGDHVIRLLDDAQNKQQTTFTIENVPPPPPSLREPRDGDSGGFLGGFRPQTNWSAVQDPSGVAYTLQIASDRDFEEVILEKSGLENPRYTLSEEEKLPRGDYFWRVKAVDMAFNESGWSNSYRMKSGVMPPWLLAALVALGLVVSGGGAYAFINSRRRRAAEEVVPPEFVRILQPETAPALGAGTAATATTPTLAAPARRALPSPFRRPRSLTPEEQARLQQVVDFVRSIPMVEVSPNLAWLEEMIESMGGSKLEIYEQVLDGEIDLAYQPAWLQHPTYEELRQMPQAESFVQGLEGYIGAVNQCAADTVVLLRHIVGDLSTAPPFEPLGGNTWRYSLTIALSTLAWFRGTNLSQPSVRDYEIVAAETEENWDPNEPAPVELHGVKASPFPGLILNKMSQEDAEFFRDLHVQMRINYRTFDEARTLASRLSSTDAMRTQISEGISQLGQMSQGR